MAERSNTILIFHNKIQPDLTTTEMILQYLQL